MFLGYYDICYDFDMVDSLSCDLCIGEKMKKQLLKTLFDEKIKGQKVTRIKNAPPYSGVKKGDTGFSNVILVHCNTCKNGELYKFFYKKNGKRRAVGSVKLLKLKEKTDKLGLKWEVFDEDLARETANKEGVLLENLL